MTTRRYFFTALFGLSVATAQAARWIGPVPPDGAISAQNLDQVLKSAPIAPTENIKVTPLTASSHGANVLVQIRGREPLHYHADSDITVFVVRGPGTIRIGDQEFPVATGDTLHIPRGVIHQFINQGTTPSVALVVFSPPPGPQDRVLVHPDK